MKEFSTLLFRDDGTDTYGYSYWKYGEELVCLKCNDDEEIYMSYPIDRFELVEK